MSEENGTVTKAPAPAAPATTSIKDIASSLTTASRQNQAARGVPQPTGGADPVKPAETTPPAPAVKPPAKGIMGALAPKVAAESAPVEPVVDPEDKVELSKEASPAAHESFRTLKEITKAERQRAAKLEADFKKAQDELAKTRGELEPVKAKLPEYEKLAQEHKQFKDRLEILDFQRHPEFVKEFVEPVNEFREKMATLMTGVPEYNIDQIMALSPGERMAVGNKVVKALREAGLEMQADEFRTSIFQLDGLERRKGKALAEHQTRLQEYNRREALSRQQAREADRGLFAEVYREQFDGMLRPAETPEGATPERQAQIAAYNAELAKVRADAERSAFQESNPKALAADAAWAAHGRFLAQHGIPQLISEFQAIADERDALKAQLAAIDRTKPGHEEGGDGGQRGAPKVESIKDISRKWQAALSQRS